jgi:nucleotide-binding universal stress UspA family protein
LEEAMNLRHIVVAADESDAGRQAVRTGLKFAARASARLTVMRVVSIQAVTVPAGMAGDTGVAELKDTGVALERLQRWLHTGVVPAGDTTPIELGMAFGIPGIEICRFAEGGDADLLVVGRKQRSQMGRLFLGDTADVVARRSRIPCLFAPPRTAQLSRILVALDGTARGFTVLQAAARFAEQTGCRLRAVTVEPGSAGKPGVLSAATPATRSEILRALLHEHLAGDLLGRVGWAGARTGGDLLEIREGDIVDQILAARDAMGAEILAIGYHRGGPPGIFEGASTARRLAHTAPCAVLTIPL